MSGEGKEALFTEDLYKRIENTLLAMPEVSNLTQDGFQYLMQGIGQAFGLKGHRGLLIRHRKDGSIKVDLSLALFEGCQVNETARYIQMVVKNIFSSVGLGPLGAIDVTITDIIKKEG